MGTRFTSGSCRRVPVFRVFFVRVIGSQVVATAEPPAGPVVGREGAHIQVAGRNVRVHRVGDDAHARGTKGATGKLGVGGGGRRWELRAADVAETGAGTLEGGAPLQHRGQAFAATGTRPGVTQEFARPSSCSKRSSTSCCRSLK